MAKTRKRVTTLRQNGSTADGKLNGSKQARTYDVAMQPSQKRGPSPSRARKSCKPCSVLYQVTQSVSAALSSHRLRNLMAEGQCSVHISVRASPKISHSISQIQLSPSSIVWAEANALMLASSVSLGRGELGGRGGGMSAIKRELQGIQRKK